MPQRRLARLNEQIKREISELLRTEVRDPRVGRPTVTAVDVTADLWLARVYVRPDPTQEGESPDEMLAGLEKAAPFIRRSLGKTLKVRRVPELRFLPDRTLEEALRIERILREIAPRPAEDPQGLGHPAGAPGESEEDDETGAGRDPGEGDR